MQCEKRKILQASSRKGWRVEPFFNGCSEAQFMLEYLYEAFLKYEVKLQIFKKNMRKLENVFLKNCFE